MRKSGTKYFRYRKVCVYLLGILQVYGMKESLLKIWSHLRRVPLFVYIGGALLFEMAFVDENSFVQSYRYSRQIARLKATAAQYREVIKNDSIRLDELKSSDENLEKFARETYQMKGKDEDVFIIVED